MKRNYDLILGIALIIYFIGINLVSNRKIAFSEVVLGIGILFIVFHFTKDMIKANEVSNKIFSIFKICVCIGVIIFLIIESFIILFPKKSTKECDYVLVLGAGVNRDGALSQTLKDRLDITLDYVEKEGFKGFIVVSGGQGSDEPISEAKAMKNYLVENGLSEDMIVMEDKSTSTAENFKFSKDKIQEFSSKDIKDLDGKIITTDFHALRANILAKKNKYGNMDCYTSNTLWYLAPTFYAREAVALVKTVIFD